MLAPDPERRNNSAIVHGVGRALNHIMNISNEPLPRALVELAQRLDEKEGGRTRRHQREAAPANHSRPE
jgi:hypothetical protein